MKTKLSHNMLIDAILLLLIVFISLGSFVMEYFLPCGGGPLGAGHGMGHGARFSAHTCLGLDRHSWGSLHMYIGIIFIVLLAFHIYQHRGMISAFINKRITSPTTRNLIYIFLVVLVLAAIFPWIVFFC